MECKTCYGEVSGGSGGGGNFEKVVGDASLRVPVSEPLTGDSLGEAFQAVEMTNMKTLPEISPQSLPSQGLPQSHLRNTELTVSAPAGNPGVVAQQIRGPRDLAPLIPPTTCPSHSRHQSCHCLLAESGRCITVPVSTLFPLPGGPFPSFPPGKPSSHVKVQLPLRGFPLSLCHSTELPEPLRTMDLLPEDVTFRAWSLRTAHPSHACSYAYTWLPSQWSRHLQHQCLGR